MPRSERPSQHASLSLNRFSCSHCGKNLTSKLGLTNHERVHTGEKPYACDTCGKSFSQEANLKRHEQIHTDEEPFSCSFCTRSFKRRENLEEHVRVHIGEKPHACPAPGCELTFAHLSVAIVHHRRVHLAIMPHVCPVCGNPFAAKRDLERHSLTHTGERPYACDTCEKRFAVPDRLKRHLQTHIGEKPFACSVSNCGQWLTAKSALRAHVQARHTPGGMARRSCDVCQKSVVATKLKEHLKTHEAARERLFPCEICKKSFYTNSDYKVHLSSVHAPKEHICGLCGKSFHKTVALRNHVRTHTRE